MILTKLDGAELPCAVRLSAPEVIHTSCNDAPRNQHGVIACCGYRFKGIPVDVGTEEGDPVCPLCVLIPEGKCACFSDVAAIE